jgi:hypothetical protein
MSMRGPIFYIFITHYMGNTFFMLGGPQWRLLELLLLAVVIFIFVGRLLMVSAYQQRTGDYFDIRLIDWYPLPEQSQVLGRRRLRVIVSANLLAKIMWLCGILLSLTCLIEQHFVR